jgi:hypothetical protein
MMASDGTIGDKGSTYQEDQSRVGECSLGSTYRFDVGELQLGSHIRQSHHFHRH